MHLIAVMLIIGQTGGSAKGTGTSDNDKPAANDLSKISQVAESVPDHDKSAKCQEQIGRMREVLAKVIIHLQNAREAKDVVKLDCVNEKLTTIKGLLKISETADVTLQEAVARQDHETAVHEFSKISLARQKCEQFLAEAEACVGAIAIYTGDLEVEVEVINGGEPEYGDADLEHDLTQVFIQERPPVASPYQ